MIGTPPAERVRSLIDFAASMYRSVVLDVPRADDNVLDALDGAARIIVVANQELSAVRNAARLVATLRQRYGRDCLVLALNRYDRQADISESDIEKVVGMAPTFLMPNDYRAAVRAANHGKPLVLNDESRLSGSIKAFATALAGFETKHATQPATGGSLFGRFAVRRT
jgi:Flp pilus assembly CpaE family ATPase